VTLVVPLVGEQGHIGVDLGLESAASIRLAPSATFLPRQRSTAGVSSI
jgi:hypothetical protein